MSQPIEKDEPQPVCKEVEEQIATGELVDNGRAHLARCKSCTAFAADVAQLRDMAQALERPAFAVDNASSRQWTPRRLNGGRLALCATAAVAVAVVGLWVAFSGVTQDEGFGATDENPNLVAASKQLGVKAGAASNQKEGAKKGAADESIDLLGALALAQQVWLPEENGGMAIQNGDGVWGGSIGNESEIHDVVADAEALGLLLAEENPLVKEGS